MGRSNSLTAEYSGHRDEKENEKKTMEKKSACRKIWRGVERCNLNNRTINQAVAGPVGQNILCHPLILQFQMGVVS